jgi:hypothetical protein
MQPDMAFLDPDLIGSRLLWSGNLLILVLKVKNDTID